MTYRGASFEEKIDAALSNYFRVGNLTALRELALLWVADRVDIADPALLERVLVNLLSSRPRPDVRPVRAPRQSAGHSGARRHATIRRRRAGPDAGAGPGRGHARHDDPR